MPRRKSSAPGVVSWPAWKTLILGLGLGGGVTLCKWWGKIFDVGFRTDPPSVPPLTIWDFLPGSGLLLIPFWVRWAWQPRRKHAHWHQWLASLIPTMYVNSLILWTGIALWNDCLNYPWNWVVNGVSVALFIAGWTMPLLSYPTAKKLSQLPWALSGPLLPFAGVAGTAGALLGMYSVRNGEMKLAVGVMGFISLFVALLMAASTSAEILWDSRPWAKEGDE